MSWDLSKGSLPYIILLPLLLLLLLLLLFNVSTKLNMESKTIKSSY